MKEYDIYVPLYYNDGSPVEPQKLQQLQQRLLEEFGGLTFFPQPNEGYWQIAEVTYRDEIVIYRVLASGSRRSRRFLSQLILLSPEAPHLSARRQQPVQHTFTHDPSTIRSAARHAALRCETAMHDIPSDLRRSATFCQTRLSLSTSSALDRSSSGSSSGSGAEFPYQILRGVAPYV